MFLLSKRRFDMISLCLFLVSIPKVSSLKEINGSIAMIPRAGVMRNLVLRVTDNLGNGPKNAAPKISDLFFGSHNLTYTDNLNSMASMFDQCSGGKLTFIPARGPKVVNGVFEIDVDIDMTGMELISATRATQRTFNELNKDLNIEFEVYSVILPFTVPGRGGLAGLGGQHQMYVGGAENSLELLVHEFGHNLGFHHSGIPNGSDYGDGSCMMGCCRWAQQMCFNAAKSWHSGWYSEEGKEGNEQHFLSNPGQFWRRKLVGIDDYLHGSFDETQHRVVLRIGWHIYMMFNRKKGTNNGVKAYGDKVVLVQQIGGGSGISRVISNMDNGTDTDTFIYSNYTADGNDLVVKVCDIAMPSTLKGPQITGGVASQSSTAVDATADRAIDGNTDQSFRGGSVTHTEEENDPWWKWTLDQPEEVQLIKIYNRNDCCSNRLNNARVELYDADGKLIFTQNIGSQINIKDIFLHDALIVKEINIKLFGNRVLSLAEVELFGKAPTSDTPDYADVLVYISGSGVELSCNRTPKVTESPSMPPTISSQPSVYTVIPKDVLLVRDNTPCTFEASWPRFKCSIKQTTVHNLPNSYGNDPVFLSGEGSCAVKIRPVVWAYNGRAFYFESSESLMTVNTCFTSGTQITELKYPSAVPSQSPFPSMQPTISFQPSVSTVIPKSVKLWRDNSSCIYEASWPRFKCSIRETTVYNLPGTYDNDPVLISGKDGCVVEIQPVVWAYLGRRFYFESQASLAKINECFASDINLIEFKSSSAKPSIHPSAPFPAPSSLPSMKPSKVSTSVPTNKPIHKPTSAPFASSSPYPSMNPSNGPTIVPIFPTKAPSDDHAQCIERTVKRYNKTIKKIQAKFNKKKNNCMKKTGSAKRKCLRAAKNKMKKQKKSAQETLKQAMKDCDSVRG